MIRAIARVVNPLVLRIAGRRHMPVLGIVHHRGRKTGRCYATPLGVRPAAAGGFVIPLTFSHASHWYQNILAAGSCIITYQGTDHAVAGPVLVDRATAGPAYPRYERLALRLIGINEFVQLTNGRHALAAEARRPAAHRPGEPAGRDPAIPKPHNDVAVPNVAGHGKRHANNDDGAPPTRTPSVDR